VFDVTLTDKYQNLSQSVNTDVTLTDKYQNLSQSVNTDVTLTDKYQNLLSLVLTTLLVIMSVSTFMTSWFVMFPFEFFACNNICYQVTSVITSILSLNCNIKLYWCSPYYYTMSNNNMYLATIYIYLLTSFVRKDLRSENAMRSLFSVKHINDSMYIEDLLKWHQYNFMLQFNDNMLVITLVTW
jgi:hypothetical protein